MLRMFRSRESRYVEIVIFGLLIHFRDYSEANDGFFHNWGAGVFRTLVNGKCYRTLWYEGDRTYAIGIRCRCPKARWESHWED